VVIHCGPYLPHGSLVEIFNLSFVVERWNLSSVSLLLSLFLKSIGEKMIAMILWFLNIRHSGTLFGMWFLSSIIVPSHPTLYRLNMWSSWVRRKGITQVMYIAKLKDGPKRVKKFFQWFWKGFLKWFDGGGENGITSKRIFGVEVSFSSQNINFPFIWRDFWSFFCSVSWGLGGFDDVWDENHFFKNFFSI
jgi:hypothetical protein